ncbi:alpha/beta fold hydrolase [Chloroflexota bacterium]
MMSKPSQFLTGTLTGAAVVLGIKSYFHYRQDLQIAEQRVINSGKKIETQLGCVVYGTQGEGPPVLVIHGAGGGFDQALHTAQMFGRGFQWVAPSRFGYLGTPLPQNPSPETQADAYAALLDALEIERVPIIGISAGGPSSLQFVLRHPERCTGLVMVSAVSQAMIDVASNPEVMEKLIDGFLSSDWMAWLGLQLAIHKIIPPMGVPIQVIKGIDDLDTRWLQTLLAYVLPLHSRRAGLVNDFSQIFKLGVFPSNQIHIPTLIIHAQDDSLVSIKQGRFSAELIPNSRLVELSSGGHLLLGQRASVQSEVEPFLLQIINAD